MGIGAESAAVWLVSGGELHPAAVSARGGRSPRRRPRRRGAPRRALGRALGRDAAYRAADRRARGPDARSRLTGRPRASERAPDRGAPVVATASRRRAGRRAPEDRTEPARWRAATARRARGPAEAGPNDGRPRSRQGSSTARHAAGFRHGRVGGPARPRARDLPAVARRQGAGDRARGASSQGGGARDGRGRRGRAVPGRCRVGRLFLVPRGLAERREVRGRLDGPHHAQRRLRRARIRVRDDGRGFDPSATSYGTGLQGIADRLAALGGELVVTSAPGDGTAVAGRLPVGEVER